MTGSGRLKSGGITCVQEANVKSLFFETQSKLKHILHLQSFNIMSCFIFNGSCIFLGEINTKHITLKKKKTGLLGSKMCRVCIFACFSG